jgi:hypothetical protein
LIDDIDPVCPWFPLPVATAPRLFHECFVLLGPSDTEGPESSFKEAATLPHAPFDDRGSDDCGSVGHEG